MSVWSWHRFLLTACVCLCLRWQVEGPDRCLSLQRACGQHGGSGQNALKPVAWASHRGAGSVYLHLLRRPLHYPTLHQTGQVIFPGASEILPSHLCVPIIPLVTLGSTTCLIALRQSPPIKTQDCLFIGTHPLKEEEGLPYQRKPIDHLLCTSQNSPQTIKTPCLLFSDLPTGRQHTATTSQHGSSGDQPILEHWEQEEGGAEGRSPPAGRVYLQEG